MFLNFTYKRVEIRDNKKVCITYICKKNNNVFNNKKQRTLCIGLYYFVLILHTNRSVTKSFFNSPSPFSPLRFPVSKHQEIIAHTQYLH